MARRPSSIGSANAPSTLTTDAAAGMGSPTTPSNWATGVSMPAPKKLTTFKPQELSHIISDDELQRMSETNSGEIGSWFFTLLGGFLGTIPALIDRAPKIGNAATPLGYWDLAVAALAVGCFVSSICLGAILYGRRNRLSRLVTEIRGRKRVTG